MKSLRLSLAVFAVIIVLWIKGDLDRLSDRRDSNDSSSLSDSAVSGAEIVVESSQTLSDTGPNGATDNLPDENPPSPPSPEINKPDRVIVVGRTRTEDTDWVINELPECARPACDTTLQYYYNLLAVPF